MDQLVFKDILLNLPLDFEELRSLKQALAVHTQIFISSRLNWDSPECAEIHRHLEALATKIARVYDELDPLKEENEDEMKDVTPLISDSLQSSAP